MSRFIFSAHRIMPPKTPDQLLPRTIDRENQSDLPGYYFLPAFLLAAQRAFISSESFFLPAGVSPLFFLADSPTPVRFLFAHRAFIAAAIFARVCRDVFRDPVMDAEGDGVVPTIEASRLCRVSICRRMESASSKLVRDVFMRCE